MTDKCKLEIPDGCDIKRYESTGYGKLIAKFSYRECEVHITPYKSYGLPGFTNSHRVTIETPEDGLEVLAEGLEVENVKEAEEVAIEAMEGMSE